MLDAQNKGSWPQGMTQNDNEVQALCLYMQSTYQIYEEHVALILGRIESLLAENQSELVIKSDVLDSVDRMCIDALGVYRSEFPDTKRVFNQRTMHHVCSTMFDYWYQRAKEDYENESATK